MKALSNPKSRPPIPEKSDPIRIFLEFEPLFRFFAQISAIIDESKTVVDFMINFSKEMWDDAVSNVAYYFSIEVEIVDFMLKIVVEDSDASPFQIFWFLHSLALNGNISMKPFEEEPGPKQILHILRYYLKCHDFIREPGEWIGYNEMWADLKTKNLYRLSSDLNFLPNVSGYDIFWKSTTHPDFFYWDYLLYPVHHRNLSKEDVCKAIWMNWVMSLNKKEIVEMRSYIDFAVKEIFSLSPEYIRVYSRIGENNPEFYRMCLMTNFGMNHLISNYDYSLKQAKSFFEKSGFVFNKSLPKMPYGFDFMAAQLNISCYARPSGLWKV